MVTAAPPQLTKMMAAWDGVDPRLRAEYPSAVFSGIIPDAAHMANGGFHVSIEDLNRHGNGGDYSNTRPLDRRPPVTLQGTRLAAAGDMSMSPTDMRKHYLRVKAVYDDRSDPRRQYFSYVNTWSGVGSATRFDFVGNRVLTASSDHKWHAHQDFPRAFIDYFLDAARADKTMRAYVSMILGESKQTWIFNEAGVNKEDQDMMFTARDGGGTIYLCWNTEYDVVAWGMPGPATATAYNNLNLPSVGQINSLADIGATPMGVARDAHYAKIKELMVQALEEAGIQADVVVPPMTVTLTGTVDPVEE